MEKNQVRVNSFWNADDLITNIRQGECYFLGTLQVSLKLAMTSLGLHIQLICNLGLLVILKLGYLCAKGQFLHHDVVLDCLLPEGPAAADPVEPVQWEESMAIGRYELDGREDEPELLL